jgi:adenylylsulfate kinase-like enzyme
MAMVIWLIGLAGAGKTSIGRHLHALLKARNPATALLDGDDLRTMVWCRDAAVARADDIG